MKLLYSNTRIGTQIPIRDTLHGDVILREGDDLPVIRYKNCLVTKGFDPKAAFSVSNFERGWFTASYEDHPIYDEIVTLIEEGHWD